MSGPVTRPERTRPLRGTYDEAVTRRLPSSSVTAWAGLILILGALALSMYAVIYGRWSEEPFLPQRFDLDPPYRIDLDVYRLGGQMLLSGGDLYGRLPDTAIGANLPFTYPPLAALLFAPLAWLSLDHANLVFSLVTVALTLVAMTLAVREVTRVRGRHLVVAGLVAGTAALWLGPVRETVEFGQVNVALMALVLVDVVAGRGKPWQGVLTGLAMAIKLTPAVFLAYFLVRRDWRALATGIVAAIGFTLLGFAVAWQDSITYWTRTITDPTRIGSPAYVSNQSLTGALHRLGLGDSATLIWFVTCAVLGLSLLVVMHHLFRSGQDLAALLTMGVYALLASPVSWSHHWVWAGPALLLLVVRARRRLSLTAAAMAAVGLGLFVGRLIWDLPDAALDGLSLTWQQQLVANAQLLWGVALLAYLALTARGADDRPVAADSRVSA